MAGHFNTLLEAAAENPDERLSDLPLLTDAERQQLLVEWNRTEVAYPRDRCLHELFEEQVERAPDAIAVVFEDKQLSYRQLNERANQLARHLQGLGVGPDTLVGICVERSLEMVVGLLGILKAGGAYVPLDPEYPKERLTFMLEDAQPLALVTQRKLQGVMPSHQATVIYIDPNDQIGAEINYEFGSKSNTNPNCLAYVLYTSGSTGRPKGVAIKHRSVVMFSTWAKQIFTAEEFAGVLFSTSICFDLSIFELFVTLANGGKVILAKNALELPTLRAAHDVRMINTVPSAMAEVVRGGGLPQSVITVNLAGEPLAQSLVDQLYERHSIRRVFDLYGPTETTTYSAFTLRERGGKATIGRPISNTKIYILDPRMQPMPIGVPGELHIGGLGLARGYHNRPGLTLEKFIPDPFSTEPGARLYKTGDLARYLPDGAIEYLGRLDHQVKIRGFRIELGEIESVFATHPAVREAVVLAREDYPDEKRLVAYLTIKEGEPPKDSELRGLLRAKLPEYMIPSAFVILDRFQLTPNGKVDRKALPRPDLPSLNQTEFVAPSTQTEKAVAGIWRQALGVERVGLHDNFFGLGGHSLMAVRVVGEINRRLNAKLDVFALYQNQTVGQLANLLERRPPVRSETQLVTLRGGQAGPRIYIIGAGPAEHRLAQLIGGDRAVFGVTPREWRKAIEGGASAAAPTFEHLAAICTNAVHENAGASPCVLMAFWQWGRPAFEAAHLLLRSGGNVALVVLVDAYSYDVGGLTRGTFFRSWRKIWRGATTRSASDNRYLAARCASFAKSWRLLLWLLWRMPRVLKWRVSAMKNRILYGARKSFYLSENGEQIEQAVVNESLKAAAKLYQPHPLDARGALIRPYFEGEELLPDFDVTNGWGDLFTRGLDVVETAGTHGSLISSENFPILVQRINSALDRNADAHAGQLPGERRSTTALAVSS